MSEFEIRISQIKSPVESGRAIAEKIAAAGRELEQCQWALDTSVSRQYGVVKQNLSGIGRRVYLESDHMKSLAQALEDVSGTYRRTESEVAGQSITHTRVQEAKSVGGSSGKEAKSVGGSSGKEATSATRDILSFLSKAIKGGNDKFDNPNAKTVSSFLSTVAKGLKLGESETLAEWYTGTVGFGGGLLGLGGKFGKSLKDLAGKYGTASMKAWFSRNGEQFSKEMGTLGTFGNAFGFSYEALKAFQDSDSVASFLKNSGGWITSGKDLVVDLKGLNKTFDKTKGGPIASMLSMGSYLAGDIIDLSTDGHPLTADEVADLCLGTGLQGLKSGVSQITFGIVDIDVDRSMGIFDKNISWMSEKISSTNCSTAGKAALGLVSTPAVAAWSVGETIVDIGYQMGEGIKQGAKSIWNFFTGADETGGVNQIGGGGGGGGGGGR